MTSVRGIVTKLKKINLLAAILASFLAMFTPACGSILALYSRVEAQGVELQTAKAKQLVIEADVKKILEDTGFIRGQLQQLKTKE
jgi:hypothetical protein